MFNPFLWARLPLSPLLCLAFFVSNATANQPGPQWWHQQDRSGAAIDPAITSYDDNALANVGQAKHFAMEALEVFWRKSPEMANRIQTCLLYTSPSPRDLSTSRMPSSA